MNYKIVFSRAAQKDYDKVKKSNLASKVKKLLYILENNPYAPPCEQLIDNLKGAYSRRINIQHRLVYKVDEQSKVVEILRMWTHYE